MIELDPDALDHALDAGNEASAAGLDDQAQAVEIIKAYLKASYLDRRLLKLEILENAGVDRTTKFRRALFEAGFLGPGDNDS